MIKASLHVFVQKWGRDGIEPGGEFVRGDDFPATFEDASKLDFLLGLRGLPLLWEWEDMGEEMAEMGRFDTTQVEDEYGNRVEADEEEAYYADGKQLWLVDYSLYLEEGEMRPFRRTE